MQKLFEYKIFRPDEEYDLVYSDEFNEAVNMTIVNFEIFGYPSAYKCLRKYVYHHLYHQIDGNEDHELIDKITGILFELQKAGLLENARKKVTDEDRKRIQERVKQESQKIYRNIDPEIRQDAETGIAMETADMASAFRQIKHYIRLIHEIVDSRGYPEVKALDIMKNGIANTVDFKVIEILWNEKRRI